MVRGAEKLRRGRGREGVWRVRSGTELLEEEEEMTEGRQERGGEGRIEFMRAWRNG